MLVISGLIIKCVFECLAVLVDGSFIKSSGVQIEGFSSFVVLSCSLKSHTELWVLSSEGLMKLIKCLFQVVNVSGLTGLLFWRLDLNKARCC